MRIVLSDHNRQRSAELRQIFLGEGLSCDAADVVGFDDLPARLAEREPELVLIACDGPLEACQSAIRAAHQVTGVPIFVAGSVEDSTRIRMAMGAGASEFLDLKRLRHELADALVRIEGTDDANQRGKIISMFSPCGGVGVSTTAVNLAVQLAGKTPREVSLVDLKPSPSDLALLLDLEPRYTVDQVCQQWDRLDRQMLATSMTQHDSGVDVLAQAGFPTEGGLPDKQLHRDAVRQIIMLLRRMYRVTVLDLDHTFADDQIEAMRLSSFIALVSRPDVTGLRRARWALDTAGQLGLPRDRFRLVLNRLGGRSQVGIEQAEEILGIKVFQSIPEDRTAMGCAVNRGIPLSDISKLSRISRSFSSFARNV